MPIPVTSGLQLLIDAADQAAVADGTAIVPTDSSGQGNHPQQPTSARRPTYRVNRFAGGKPALRFSGGACSLYGSFAAWGGNAGVTLLLAIASMTTPAPAFSGVVSLHAGGNDFSSLGGVAFSANGQGIHLSIESSGNQSPLNPYLPAAACVFGMGFSATERKAFGDYGTYYTTSGGPTLAASAGYVIGNRFLGSVSTDYGGIFDLGVVAVYNRLLTDAEARDVCQWMRNRTIASDLTLRPPVWEARR